MTPSPTPAGTSPAVNEINWDAVSGIADSIMALGTVLTLFFIAWTVRQQGKALNLQIRQLQDVQAKNEEERLEAQRFKDEHKLTRARKVRVTATTLRAMDSDGRSSGRDLATLILGELRSSQWQAAAIKVYNPGQQVIRNVSAHGEGLERPDWIWRENVKVLLDVPELDELASDSTAWFVWLRQDEQALAAKQVEIRFSDEDALRWSKDLHGRTARIDHL